MILFQTLDAALSLRRPHGSLQVAELMGWLIEHTPQHLSCNIDAAGNLHIDARTEANHRTLFIAHLDTVHRTGGANNINKFPKAWVAGDKEQCLGADDGAGVAMLMHLMHSGVPGYYIFSQGEEVGGVGARFLANYDDATLLQFDRAIAFDRKGIDSVITHQGMSRCCSDEFAQALASALTEASGDLLWLLPDDSGVYTDTAEFTELIPECTNISVGYEGAHTDRESLDIEYLQTLAQAAALIDWDGLPTTRDPSVHETKPYEWEWADQSFGTTPWIPVGKGMKYTLEDELEDALCDAFVGRINPLVALISEYVYPEDPDTAKRCINKNRLTEEVLDWAQDQLYEGTPPIEILEDLFEGAQTH